MAVVGTAKEIWRGQTGTRKEGEAREYTGIYQVETDAANDGVVTVKAAAGLPADGSAYSFDGEADASAYLVELTPSRRSGTRLLWDVVCKWKTPGDEDEDKEDKDGNPTSDPLLWRPDIEFGTAQFSSPVEKAINWTQMPRRPRGTLGPVTNSAGTIHDPALEMDDSRMVLRITRNEAKFPGGLAADFRDAINADAYTFITLLDVDILFVISKYQGKMLPITGSHQFQNNKFFWKVRYECHVDTRYGWRPQVLDRGVMAKAEKGDPDGKGGTFYTSPLVNHVPEARPLIGNDGHPILVDVRFDGLGQPLALAADPVYLTWGIYKELAFIRLGI